MSANSWPQSRARKGFGCSRQLMRKPCCSSCAARRFSRSAADALPGEKNGRKLADEALELSRSLKILFMTGYAKHAIIHHVDRMLEFIYW